MLAKPQAKSKWKMSTPQTTCYPKAPSSLRCTEKIKQLTQMIQTAL